MEPVHIHKSKIDNNLNVFLLLIPPIVFILILGLFLLIFHKTNAEIAATSQPDVLGDEASLDKYSQIQQNE